MAKKTLDLHGRQKDEVFDLVDRFITQSVNSSLKQVTIMPGKGKGILRKEVIRYLDLAHYQWQFDKTSGGSKNEGAIIVFL